MGLLDYFDPDRLKAGLQGLLGKAPIVKALHGEKGRSFRQALLDMPIGDAEGAYEAALNVGPMGMFGGISKYARRSRNIDSPFNDVPWAMFKKSEVGLAEELDKLSHYGPASWVATDQYAVPIKSLQKAMIREIRRNGLHREYNTTAAQLAREANPSDIVNSAGLYDNTELVSRIFGDSSPLRNIRAVTTDDGMVVFDATLAKKVRR